MQPNRLSLAKQQLKADRKRAKSKNLNRLNVCVCVCCKNRLSRFYSKKKTLLLAGSFNSLLFHFHSTFNEVNIIRAKHREKLNISAFIFIFVLAPFSIKKKQLLCCVYTVDFISGFPLGSYIFGKEVSHDSCHLCKIKKKKKTKKKKLSKVISD